MRKSSVKRSSEDQLRAERRKARTRRRKQKLDMAVSKRITSVVSYAERLQKENGRLSELLQSANKRVNELVKKHETPEKVENTEG